MPAGFEVTVPLPVPASLTVRAIPWVVVLISTETTLPLKLGTTRSGAPSPLKSPITAPATPRPTTMSCFGWKVPSPLPSSTETVLPWF